MATNGQKLEEPHELHQLYLMFDSSNFFWENLREINAYQVDFEINCQDLLKVNYITQVNHRTCGTEMVVFNYNSNSTFTPHLDFPNDFLFKKENFIKSGTTYNHNLS